MRVLEVEIEGITRVEGHMNLVVVEEDGRVEARAEALEGTRLLERLLIGRKFYEVPDIVSRMCGVCPVIHRLASVQALERAMGVEVSEGVKALRYVLAIGGHIQSHILHLYAFVLPDFTGHSSILELARDNVKLVRSVLRAKRLANTISEVLGGRAVHPVTPIVGGFSKVFSRHELELALKAAQELAVRLRELASVILELEMPAFERETRYLALRRGADVPLLDGTISVLGGGAFEAHEYEDHLEYVTEEYSMARHYLLKGEGVPYMVGALARLNHNHPFLSDTAKELAKTYGVRFPSCSPFDNNKAQALELVHYAEKAVELLEELLSSSARIGPSKFEVKRGEGVSATEAPRGLLIHHYALDGDGRVRYANIITPTAQNYKNLEADARELVRRYTGAGEEELVSLLKKLVRAYDPCVSCSARFWREH